MLLLEVDVCVPIPAESVGIMRWLFPHLQQQIRVPPDESPRHDHCGRYQAVRVDRNKSDTVATIMVTTRGAPDPVVNRMALRSGRWL